MSDIETVAQACGTIFIGGPREIAVSDDLVGGNWILWYCPLEKVTCLDVNSTFLVAVGGGQFAACTQRSRGRVWQVLDLSSDNLVALAITGKGPGAVAYAGTDTGKLFKVKLRRRRSLADWLGMSQTGPELQSERMEVPQPVEMSGLEVGAE